MGDPKPLPKGAIEEVLVSKLSAGRSQLETAIQLWFQGGDPVSIHALAVAAADCLNALKRHKTGEISNYEAWLKTKSARFQAQARESQNFFKHGFKDLKGKFLYPTIQGEMLLMDACVSYESVGEKPTPLMRLYTTRFLFEHPHLIVENAKELFAKNAEVHQLANSTRHEFFQKLFPIFLDRYRSGGDMWHVHL